MEFASLAIYFSPLHLLPALGIVIKFMILIVSFL